MARLIIIVFALSCLQLVELQELEPVYAQVSKSGHPVIRKEKNEFETAHKLPPSVTYVLNEHAREKREASPQRRRVSTTTPVPAPAPAGSIKLDVQKLLAKYKEELKTSTTTRASTSKSRKRIKKEAKNERRTTSPRPALTSGAPPTPRTLEVKEGGSSSLLTSSSDKQRSRIQIKKGPNGQEYEYEYVYYYYDDDEDKSGKEKVTNSHDGPGKEEQEKKFHESTVNEILPNRSKTRGRQLEDEDVVGEERLPANTRFPPRSRNLATTPLPQEDKPKRIRGKPSTETDSISEETQGTRGRTRANVRRPSLDLVDSESFNTHNAGSTPNSQQQTAGPAFPADLPAGPVRFLGATPNERLDLQDIASRTSETEEASTDAPNKEEVPATTSNGEDTSTAMSPMDKVALDLYAILQGTQKLSGEDEVNTEDSSETTEEGTTLEPSTDPPTTPEPTTTTTTTTTPPPPPTTTTTEVPAPSGPHFGKGRIRGNKPGQRKFHGTSTTTETAVENKDKPKSRYGRPSFGRPRPGGRSTTSEPAHEPEATKEESKPSRSGRPSLNRRFGTSRTKPSTEATSTEEGVVSSTRPSLARSRPAFHTRGRTRTTTTTPTDGENQSEESAVETSTSPKPKIKPGGGVRPLRPGPRLNIGRGRPGQHTTTTTTTPSEEKPEEIEDHSEESPKEEETSPPPVEDKSPLGRLRSRQKVNASALRPKAAASAPVQVRRINPLIARKRPSATTESASSAPPSESTDLPEEQAETEATPSSTTTEEPRGLNKLLAGRRRLAARTPTPAH